jgi:pimeloyl-ACP methyl ester carboxylesterase
VIAGCESEPGSSLQNNIDTGNASTFDPSNSVIPFPNDLLFQGTLDGTLNIPVDNANDLSDPMVALNALDGFSTNAPISAGFAGSVSAASITASSVRVFEVTTTSGAVTGHVAELQAGVDFFATVSSINSGDLVIVPLKPLKPKTIYQVVVTNDLMSTAGNAMLPSTTYALAKSTTPYFNLMSGERASGLPAAFTSFSDADLAQLEGLRQIVSTGETVAAANAAAPTLTTAEIILSWSFTTQSISDVLDATRTQVQALVAVSGFSPIPATASPLGAADVHVGVLQVPYFLTAPVDSIDTGGVALGSFWQGAGGGHLTQFNLNPVSTSTQTIPLLVSIPDATTTADECPAGVVPAAGWPVVIFQHGITRNRTDMMAVADAFAGACMAVVAIDLPLHGLTGLETDGTQAFYEAGGTGERSFDLDVVTQDADGNITGTGGDGVIDSSGSNFINLTNLLNTRDNLRQAVSDLFVLVDALQEGAVTDGTNTFDASKIYFLGHSLGGIVGTPFLALEAGVRDAVIAMSGSGVAKILDGSASYGTVIAGGLAANGVLKGTSDYEAFVGAAQTVVDSADPVNYALNAAGYAPSAAAGRGVLFFEVVGDSVLGNASDLVVPNTVPDGNDSSGTIAAPLSGTEALIKLLALPPFNTDQVDGGGLLLAATRYTAGNHGSILDPTGSTTNLAVTTEMQTQAVTFLASDGAMLDVNDSSVLLAP